MITGKWKLTAEDKLNICRGLLDAHLGKVFSSNEVFSNNPYYLLRVEIKRIYWRLRQPFYHRNCKVCKKYRLDIEISRKRVAKKR